MLLPPGYEIRTGSVLDRAILVKFIQRTYQELFPDRNFSHLAETVDQYFSKETPVWWVEFSEPDREESGIKRNEKQQQIQNPKSKIQNRKVACLWVGSAVDQVQGDRHANIFLLYVAPEHRRQGIGKALMRLGEDWAKARGDRQISLQVFQFNQPALNLYRQLGYQTQSLWMVKSLLG